MMPRFRLAHIWLIGGVADDRIWLRRSAALPAALTDGFKGAFTVAGRQRLQSEGPRLGRYQQPPFALVLMEPD
jgi:hypothetical protein